MIEFDASEKLWVEKYRPTKIDDCILQDRTKEEVKNTIAEGHIPNLMFYGPPGCGKTTLAKAMCRESKVDWILINGSNERGIDVIREKIVTFASTASLDGNSAKVVIIDEGDRLTPVAQDSLKSEIERFSKTCSFIITSNHPNNIIPPLLSRLVSIDFKPNKDEWERMQAELFIRICAILDNEKVKYNELVLIQVIQKFFPDNRRIIGELQQYSKGSKEINEGILMQIKGASIDELVKAIANKEFKKIVQWSADNANLDTSVVYEELYKNLKNICQPQSIPDIIMILEDFQRYDSVVPSKELHLSAMGTELMMAFKGK